MTQNIISLEQVDAKTACFKGNTFSYKHMIGAIPGSAWNKKSKRWEIPLESVPDAKRIFPSLEISASLQRAHMAMRERQQQAIAVKNIDPTTIKLDIKGLRTNKGTLYPYQSAGVKFLDTLQQGEGGILAFDMGLGKSLTSLATALMWKERGVIDYILVVCPAPLKYATWEKEVAEWTNLDYVVVDGDARDEDGKLGVVVEWEDGKTERLKGRPLRAVQYQQWQFDVPVIITNYELFLEDSEGHTWVKERKLTEEEHHAWDKLAGRALKSLGASETKPKDSELKKAKEQANKAMAFEHFGDENNYTVRQFGGAPYGKWFCRKEKRPSILPPINDRWCVIMDECHRVKNPKADTTKAIRNALAPAGRKILGSGTPLENNIQELWSTVDFCRPNLLGNYYKFVERYVECDFFGKPIAPKPQMMKELQDRIAPIMIRKTKAEALPDLPPMIVQEYWVDMTKEQSALYKQVKEGILQNAMTQEFSYLETLTQLTRIQQVCDSPAILRELLDNDKLPFESGKLVELPKIIEDIDPKRNKFILFSQYAEMTDILYPFLIEECGLRKDQIGYVKGGLKAQDLKRIQSDFQTGGIQCVLMTTAGNYGLDLSAGSYVIEYDQLFNPQKMEQVRSRLHRNGVKNAVTVISMMTKDTYEENKKEKLEGKRELFRAVIDENDESFAKLFTTKELLDLI